MSSIMTENYDSALSKLSAARNEIKNLRQQIISLKHAHRKDVEEVKHLLDAWTCKSCQNQSSASTSTASVVENSENDIPNGDPILRYIGYVETGFSTKRGVPRQPGILSQSQGILRLNNSILTNPEHALEGLEQYSHMWIVFYFHANHNTHVKAKVAPPRLNGVRTGVFATRSPHRPTPIGLSLVKIDGVEDDCILFSGVDMIDGTPVLDIKPYIPQYDMPYPSNPQSNTTVDIEDASFTAGRTLQWERLPRESDGRSEDGDSILQDQSDTDIDFQDRLLVGEASQLSINDAVEVTETSQVDQSTRILDGRDSDEVFVNDSQNIIANSRDDSYFDRPLRSPLRSTSQREAPEGSEGSSPPSPAQNAGNVRVASWISNPRVIRLHVRFSDSSISAIARITGNSDAAARFKSSIVSVLSEDPRSVYVRNRHPNEQFTCMIERMIIKCVFDDLNHQCVVMEVEEDLPNM